MTKGERAHSAETGGISLIAFTKRGAALMEKLRQSLGGDTTFSQEEMAFSLSEWTGERFYSRQALIFVGAAGIAVRAIAPFVKSKAEDPAVVVIDEGANFVLPLLSGHLGGANALALEVADIVGATPVITTATDVNDCFAVDLWAKTQGLAVRQLERIKQVSSKLLAGEEIGLYSRWPVAGRPPAGLRLTDEPEAEVTVDIYDRGGSGLQLVPACCTLGIGCRRGAGADDIERAFDAFCAERGLLPQAVCSAASIDLKRDEEGLLEFCHRRGWRIAFFSAAELKALPGPFTASPFVERTVGVDNVCERSSLLATSDEDSRFLLEAKYAAAGVTLALACVPPRLDWRY